MEPFLGEIRMVGFGFAPQGWAACDGQLLSIEQNAALFALLGIQFGGDGVTTFALPDLRAQQEIEVATGGKRLHGAASPIPAVKFVIAVRGIYPPRP